ncbi:MAG: hypothetical protein ACRDL8_11840, partial [Solirubrobacteraceae bacterium]
FELIEASVCRTQTDRALFDALAETWLANEDIRSAHTQLLEVVDALLRRAQEAGAVRRDIGAVDLVMLIKGVCESASAFQHVNPEVAMRQLDLVRAAISARGHDRPLRGRPPTAEDLERTVVVDPGLSATA